MYSFDFGFDDFDFAASSNVELDFEFLKVELDFELRNDELDFFFSLVFFDNERENEFETEFEFSVDEKKLRNRARRLAGGGGL